MKKIILSIRREPINLILILTVLLLYMFNNLFLKTHTHGLIQMFFICHFNDLICPLFFIGYSNLLLGCLNKKIKKLSRIMLLGL